MYREYGRFKENPDTTEGFRQIQRVLTKGGRAAIGLRSREKMQWSGFDQEGFPLDHRYQDRAYDDVIVVGTC